MKRRIEDGRVSKKTKYVNEEQSGALGIIESVSLKNFMCHENLTIEFDPHMNFIVGLNGSGKSAILTGIILALGGKSSATGRFANIRGFIKSGKHSASLTVTLKNYGPSAYKPHEFGDKILVERTINTDGVSSYKLKSENGRIISTSKETLNNILEMMDIMIENPVTILTQEISRNFLLHMKEDKLFTLFYKGTGLEKVEKRYKYCNDSTLQNESDLLKKKAILDQREKELKSIKVLLDAVEKIDDYKHELLWARVIEIEKRRDEKKSAFDKAEASSHSVEEKLESLKSEYEETIARLNQLNDDANKSDSGLKLRREDLQKLKSNADTLQNSVLESKGALNRYKRELSQKSKEITAMESIKENAEKIQNDKMEAKRKLLEEIAFLENEVQNMSAKSQQLEVEQESLIVEESDIHEKYSYVGNEINASQVKIKHMEKELALLLAGNQQRVNVYGTNVKYVLADIEEANKRGLFSKKPVGPVGLYLTVKDERWCFAIENFLKSRLGAFCCDNVADSKKLDAIFKKYYTGKKSPAINISKFQESHVDKAYRIQSSYPTVLDLLDIKHPVVANFLLDQYNVESVLLIDNDEAAVQIMMRNPPRYCTRAFTLNGDEFHPNPFRQYSCLSKNSLGLLKSLSETELNMRKEELSKATNEFMKMQSFCKDLKQSLQAKQKELDDKNALKKDVMSKKMKLDLLIRNKKRVLEEKMEDSPFFQEDLDQHITEKTYLEEKIREIEASLEKHSEELAVVTSEFQTKQQILKKELDKRCKTTETVVTLQNAKAKQKVLIENFEVQLKKNINDKKALLSECNSISRKAEKALTEAEKVCSRIETEKNVETLETLIEETSKAFNHKSKSDREALQQSFLEKTETLFKHRAEYASLDKKIQKLKSMCKLRLDMMTQIRNYTAISLNLSFTTLLKENKFIGSVTISFESKSLKIEARPAKVGNQKTVKHQASNLSGGERSYVTIAFLLALWDRIEMPFRILDEYDVFMDSDNRHLSVNLLIRNAVNKNNMQFIFLTPQELPAIRDCPDIKIHKMHPPVRQKKV